MAVGIRVEAQEHEASGATRTTVPKDRPRSGKVHTLQRKLGNQVVQRMLGRGEVVGDTEVLPVQAPSLAQGFTADDSLIQRLQARRGGGAPLPVATRSRMEASFGADFGAVRTHTDAGAAELSGSLQARAFTQGNDIFFSGGAYAPETPAGQHLLAHELTHVLQQSGAAAVQPRLKVGAADNACERAADRAADQVLRGEQVSAIGPAPTDGLQRAYAPGMVITDNTGVHKSNRKNFARGRARRLEVSSGIKARLPYRTKIEIDRAQTSGDYVLIRYQTGAGEKLGYVRGTKVKTYAELGDAPENDTLFRNHQQRSIHNETNAFLGHVGAIGSGLFDGRPTGLAEVGGHDEEETLGITAPANLDNDQEAFLAGRVLDDWMAAAETYNRGFIVRYQSYPNRFHNLMRHGKVLWTLDSDSILSIGSPYNNKHAVVAGGKDVFAAGEAHLKTGHELGLQEGTLTQRQIELWSDVQLGLMEIEQLRRGGEEGMANDVALANANLIQQIGGQDEYDRITNLTAPVDVDDAPLVVLDFGSGHYAPRDAWGRATTAWRNAGFVVEWDRESAWV